MKKLLASIAFALALNVSAAHVPALAAVGDDPCTTVPKADVTVALKGSIASQKSQQQSLAVSCTYQGQVLGLVTVTAYRGNAVDDTKKQYGSITDRMAKIYPAMKTPFTGVGDEGTCIRTACYVRKGTAIYVFDVLGRPGPDTTARSMTLAKATMPHIKG